MKSIYALLCGLLISLSSWAQCVEELNPPASANWSSAYFHSPGQGWVAGDQGQLYHTEDGGQSWNTADPRTAADLHQVNFLDQVTGWVVGDGGIIRRTTNGGQSWQQQFSPIGADLNGVDFIFSNLGLVAGDCGTLLRTLNGGAAWSWLNVGTSNNLNAVLWVNTQVALAAGEGGVVLRSLNGGQTWSEVMGTGAGDHLALAANGGSAWLSGEGGTYFSPDAGQTWEEVSSYSFKSLEVNAAGTVIGAGGDGLVAVSYDNGQTWTELNLSAEEDWNAVVLTGLQSGYLFGAGGSMVAFRFINASANGPELVCSGASVQLSGGAVPGDPSYTWTGPGGFAVDAQTVSFVPSESGWYVLNVEENGCVAKDSLFLEVAFVPEVELGEDVVLCEGETVTLSGPDGDYTFDWSVGSSSPDLQVSSPGIYSLTVTTDEGCIASDMVSVEIQENGVFFLDTLLCSGETLEVNGIFYDEFNPTGTEVLPGAAANGCDSLIIVQIEFSFTEPITLDTAVCETAFPFTYGDLEVNGPGDYFTQITNAEGCLQMVFMNVQALQNYEVTVDDSFCEGSFYVWDGQVLTNPGTYIKTFSATDGCDSTVTLNLSVLPPAQTDLALEVCEGETVMVGNLAFDTTGFYEVELTGTGGCDSIVNLDLTVLPADLITETAGICAGDTYTWLGMMLNDPGQYQVTFANSLGCDSIRQLDLTVFSNPELFIVDTLPDNGTGNGAAVLDVVQGQAPFSVSWSNGGIGLVQTGLASGTYTVSVTDANDCSDTLLVFVPMTTSLREPGNAEVAVWPNPSSGQLWIGLPEAWNRKEVRLQLFNALGEGLRSWRGEDAREALELAVPHGAYWLGVEYQGRRQLNKVIVVN